MRSAVIAFLVLVPAAAAQQRTQVHFKDPAGMKVYWLIKKDLFSTTPLETPGRFNLVQGAPSRLKLPPLPDHPALELFPTLQVATANPQTREFLEHSSVPVSLTREEIDQVVKEIGR